MKVAFYTLGCKVNQYETQAMEQMMTARGHQLRHGGQRPEVPASRASRASAD